MFNGNQLYQDLVPFSIVTACHIKIQEALRYDALLMRTELFSVIVQQVVVILTDVSVQHVCPIFRG